MRKTGRQTKAKRTRQAPPAPESDDLLPEYDFSQGVRNKYAERYRAGTILRGACPEQRADPSLRSG